MRALIFSFLLVLPLAALAQSYSNAPLLVVKQPAASPSSNPPTPAPQPMPETPTTPVTPAAPVAPPNPISKLWPRDAVPVFMVSCTKFNPDMIEPCSCIITKVMTQFAHDEFMHISEADAIESDPRLLIRQQCVSAAPDKLKKRSVTGNKS